MKRVFYLTGIIKINRQGVEIIGLAYEIKPEFEYARDRVLTMKEKLSVPYDFLIAGTSSTESASESLPMLNKVMSFPTSIIIDKKGKCTEDTHWFFRTCHRGLLRGVRRRF